MKSNSVRKIDIEKNPKPMEPQYDIIKGAWQCDYGEIGNALAENPANINKQDANGLTACHISVALANFGVLQTLVESDKFDPFITDNFNRRAIDCIQFPRMNKFRKLLLSKMYDVSPKLDT